jgi:hypothetical protein
MELPAHTNQDTVPSLRKLEAEWGSHDEPAIAFVPESK